MTVTPFTFWLMIISSVSFIASLVSTIMLTPKSLPAYKQNTGKKVAHVLRIVTVIVSACVMLYCVVALGESNTENKPTMLTQQLN